MDIVRSLVNLLDNPALACNASTVVSRLNTFGTGAVILSTRAFPVLGRVQLTCINAIW